MAFEPFATADAYRALYPSDEVGNATLAALLRAASLRLDTDLARFRPGYERGSDATYDEKLSVACCEMVHDAASVPDAMQGATQYSQGAGGYTASVTYSAARGRLALTKPLRHLLGFERGGIGSIAPMTLEDRS